MVSLDNLKTAVSAIKSEISSIASRYLKKTDADSIYITKKTANNSFATKSSVPKILGFDDVNNPGNTHAIRSLKLPDSIENYDTVLGFIKYGDYTEGNLCMAGYRDIQFAFSADTIDNVYASDTGALDPGSKSLRYLESGESVTGIFATDEASLVRAKRAALSSTGREFNTRGSMQGVIYHDVHVDGINFRLISTNRDNYQAVNARLYEIISTQHGLFYFVSASITEDTAAKIPFTITRLDGEQPEKYDAILDVTYQSGGFSTPGIAVSKYEALKAKLTSIGSKDIGIRVRVDMVVYGVPGMDRYSQIVPSSVEYEEDTENIALTYYGYGNVHDIYTKGWFKLTIDSSGSVSDPVAL